MNYSTTLSDFTTKVRPSLGATKIEVSCIATIKDEYNNAEEYEVSFIRDPISGNLQHVNVEDRVETTEHTLISEKVAELVEEELDKL